MKFFSHVFRLALRAKECVRRGENARYIDEKEREKYCRPFRLSSPHDRQKQAVRQCVFYVRLVCEYVGSGNNYMYNM